MKTCKTLYLFFLLGWCAWLFGQNAAVDPELVRQKFRSFDYDAVISLAEAALEQMSRYTPDQLIEIYEMKAMAHFSQADLEAAKLDFIEVLCLDSLHTLDPVQTSPKIVTFFNSIKEEYERQVRAAQEPPLPERIVVHDTVTVVQETLGAYKTSIPFSMVLPGLGHLIMGEGKRGLLLTTLSTLTLTSAAYMSWDAYKKEKEYMNATSEPSIAATYDSYNLSYRRRNTLLAAYAVLWIYTQADLIVFQEKRHAVQVTVTPPASDVLQLSLAWRF